MSAKHFCLKWNSFQTSLLNAFGSLQNTEDLADVTLTCEGFNLKAHKFILSACSPYFRTVFKENPCQHPIVILKDVLYVDLIAIINFMYHGEVLLSEEQLPSFLNTARVLQVSGLNTTDSSSKKVNSPKRTKTTCTDSYTKKLKRLKESSCSPNRNNEVLFNLAKECNITSESPPKTFEHVEVDAIKVEKDDEQVCADVNENVEKVSLQVDQQGSILEAALDSKRSILERSLTAHLGKIPIQTQYASDQTQIQAIVPKISFVPKKPLEPDLEKQFDKVSDCSPARSNSPIVYDRPSEILQQSLKVDDETYETNDPATLDDVGKTHEIQPHHSSQCGTCPHCGKVYSNQSALKYHVRLVHSDLTNMYCCHLCPEAFDFREGYKKHMAEAHCIRN